MGHERTVPSGLQVDILLQLDRSRKTWQYAKSNHRHVKAVSVPSAGLHDSSVSFSMQSQEGLREQAVWAPLHAKPTGKRG